MAKTKFSDSQARIWRVIADLRLLQTKREEELKKGQAELDKLSDFYKAQYEIEFDPDDADQANTDFIPPAPGEKHTKPSEPEPADARRVKAHYDSDGKIKDKIFWAVEYLGGEATKNQIINCLLKKEKGLTEASVANNFYSMAKVGYLSRPNGWGGSVKILTRTLKKKNK